MRIEKVPVDMSSEQKDILGIASKRQLTYLIVGGLIVYTYVPFIFKLFMGGGWLLAAIIALVTAIPTVTIVLLLGFVKVQEFNMNRDYYYYIRFQRKTQYGSWRKGR